MDQEMRYMMDLCNRCLQANLNEMFSLSDTEQIRQTMGLYRILVTARDFESLQRIAILARKCLNGSTFVYAFMRAIRDRQDTYTLIIPKIYEVMPDMYYTKEDMEEMNVCVREETQDSVSIDRNKNEDYLDKSYIWMPFREMHKQIMLQKMSGKMLHTPMSKDKNQNKIVVSLKNKMQNMDTMVLFMEDLDLKAYVDDLVFDMMAMMRQDEEMKNEQEMRMRNYMQEQNTHRFGMGISDARTRYMDTIFGRETNDKYDYRMNKMSIDQDDMTNYRTNKMNTLYGGYGNNMLDRQGNMERNRDEIGNNRGYFSLMNRNNNLNYQREMQHIKNELPTRDINDDRLLHVGRRRKDSYMNQGLNAGAKSHRDNVQKQQFPRNRQNSAMYHRSGIKNGHSVENLDVVDSADANPRGLEGLGIPSEYFTSNYVAQNNLRDMSHSYSTYLQQQHDNMLSQMRMSSKGMYDNQIYLYGMRQKRNTEFGDDVKYQRGRILLHNIRQLMTRIKMERISLGEYENVMTGEQNMGVSNTHQDLDRMRAIFFNRMGLNTRQSRLLLQHLNEIEKVINLSIERELQMQKEDGNEKLNIDRLVLNILMGRVQGLSIVRMLNELQQDIMQQNSGEIASNMQITRRRINVTVIMHFLARMNQLINMQEQSYGQNYDLNELILPTVTITDLKVDKLNTFIDSRDDDLINFMSCPDKQRCLEMKKVMSAQQPRLNHKTFNINMQILSDREQDVIMRIYLAPQNEADFMLLDTRVRKLQQGKNSIKQKSSDIMWTMKESTSYSKLYQEVMNTMQNKYQTKLQQTVNQNCRFPHHLLLPRGRIDGLPMRMIVMVSSIDDSTIPMEKNNMICAMGVGNIQMNRNNLRLDQYIRNGNDIQRLVNLPNIEAKDVSIYHE